MKLRHELKHYINRSDYIEIRNRLQHLAKLDRNAKKNGEYKIRSIYFDDYQDKVLMEKIIGLNNRDKFRIRFYNDDPSFIRLEKKSKISGLCRKISSVITKAECECILRGDLHFLRDSPIPLLKELYIRMNSESWKPKTVVDYVREAYIYEAGNVRITFDKSVRTGLCSTDIFNPELPTVETLDTQLTILEVKYDAFLPEVIADCIQIGERSRTSVSKYALCRMYG